MYGPRKTYTRLHPTRNLNQLHEFENRHANKKKQTSPPLALFFCDFALLHVWFGEMGGGVRSRFFRSKTHIFPFSTSCTSSKTDVFFRTHHIVFIFQDSLMMNQKRSKFGVYYEVIVDWLHHNTHDIKYLPDASSSSRESSMCDAKRTKTWGITQEYRLPPDTFNPYTHEKMSDGHQSKATPQIYIVIAMGECHRNVSHVWIQLKCAHVRVTMKTETWR